MILKGAWIDQMSLPTITGDFNYLHIPKNVTDNGKSQTVLVTIGVATSDGNVLFKGGPTVVYVDPKFSKGPIVHQAVAKVKFGNEFGLITKGVNNSKTDQEAGIDYVSQNRILGQVLFKIPFVGYIKTILFGTLDFRGCNRTYEDSI